MTFSYNDILNAVLSMDVYYRESDSTLTINGQNFARSDIGGSTTKFNSGGSITGFVAEAYSYGNETIIAYRGTDSFAGGIQSFLDIGASSLFPQSSEALAFYQEINGGSLAANSNIILTGHSLGGGLAGFVASLTGTSAVVFDNIGYDAAATLAYPALEAQYTAEHALWLAGGQVGPEPVSPVFPLTSGGNVAAYNLLGEAAEATRGNPSTAIDPQAGLQNPRGLHSMASLVLYMFGQDYSRWSAVGSKLYSALYNNTIALAVGDTNADTLRTELAYTVLEANTPYGTTAALSLFKDADTLGAIVGSGGFSGVMANNSVLTALTEILVQYAADQAAIAGDRGGSDGTGANANGAFSVQGSVLQVNLDPTHFLKTYQQAAPNIVGLSNFVSYVSNALGIGQAGSKLAASIGSNATQILIATAASADINTTSSGLAGLAAPNNTQGQPGSSIIVGADGAGVITVGSDNNMIVGGAIVKAGDGNNLIAGETGAETVMLGLGNNFAGACKRLLGITYAIFQLAAARKPPLLEGF